MGLLDDAIREHLDLKRRRGADPDEVARQEQEALGPPRRGEFAAPAGDAELGPEDAHDLLPEDEEPLSEDTGERPAAVAASRLDEPAGPDLDDDDRWVETAPDEGEQSTAEFAAQETRDAPQGDDVLEETPEFLQETPEHDRLWFEQRPPRDFDFDK